MFDLPKLHLSQLRVLGEGMDALADRTEEQVTQASGATGFERDRERIKSEGRERFLREQGVIE